MTISNKTSWMFRLAACAALLAGAVGCQLDKPEVPLAHGEEFPPYDADRSVYQFSTMQAANAAHADSTLRSYHFDGAMLNSLGEERLDLILRNGDTPTPLVVYIDLSPDDSKTLPREKAVTAFLRDRGLAIEQIELREGPNPDVNTFVAPLLAGQAGTSAAPGAGSSAAAAPASGAGH